MAGKAKSKVTAKSGRVLVTRTVRGVETDAEETMEVNEFLTDTASVGVKAGHTCNLGNYESARIDVMVSVPCYMEEIDKAFVYVRDLVDKKLSAEVRELRESRELA